MFKKLMAISLILCLTVVTFTGCKDKAKSTATSSATVAAKTNAATKSSTASATSSSTSAATAASTAQSTAPASTASSAAVTDYSIEYDFQIKTEAAGIVFGYKDETQFLMWQVNCSTDTVMFRPHRFDSGFTVINEIDVSNAIKSEDKNKTHHLKVTIDSKNEIKTYINNILVDTYTDELAAYGKFGIRENMGNEEAYFDNIVIKNTITNQELAKYDFESGVNPFAETSTSEIVSGVVNQTKGLLISKCSSPADISVIE